MPGASECAQTGDVNYDQGEDAAGWGNVEWVEEGVGKKEEAKNVQQSACRIDEIYLAWRKRE